MARRPNRNAAPFLRRVTGLLVIAAIGGGVWWALSDQAFLSRLKALAGSSDVDLADSPAPRAAATPGNATDLSEMPALVATGAGSDAGDAAGGATPDSWPALAPSALLEQSASAGRALNDTEFDQPPWRRFARPAAVGTGHPRIGILLTGLGNDRAIAAAAIAGLPADVTLSFSPYAPDLSDWIAAARAFGHEAMVDLPLQAKDGRDLGALGVMTALNQNEAGRRIDAIAGSADHVVGFAAAGGDALLLDDQATATVLGETARLGLGFIDTSGEPMSLGATTAKASGAPFARTVLSLDDSPSRAGIAARLAVALQLASRDGGALAVAHASPATITAIADWTRQLGDNDPATVPASAFLKTD